MSRRPRSHPVSRSRRLSSRPGVEVLEARTVPALMDGLALHNDYPDFVYPPDLVRPLASNDLYGTQSGQALFVAAPGILVNDEPMCGLIEPAPPADDVIVLDGDVIEPPGDVVCTLLARLEASAQHGTLELVLKQARLPAHSAAPGCSYRAAQGERWAVGCGQVVMQHWLGSFLGAA